MKSETNSDSVNLDKGASGAPCGIEGPTREQHLAWCKKRALEYVEQGNVHDAFASMASDLQKHPGTANHIGATLGMMQLMTGMLKSPAEMRRFIEGFN